MTETPPIDIERPELVAYAALFDELKKRFSTEQLADINRAFTVARDAHEGQKRRSGEPYITHPIAVAGIVNEMRLDHLSVMGALLHDVLEDTDVSRDELVEQFSETLADIVDGLSKLKSLEYKSTFPHIKVKLKETARNASLVNYEMRTQLKSTVPAGVSEGDLFVVVEENNARRQVPIHFNAKVVSLKISPEILTLSNVKPGVEVKKTIILQAAKAFDIVDVKCKTKAFRVRQKKKGKRKVHMIDVIYKGEEAVGSRECDLSFYTDLNKGVSGVVKAIVSVSAE